MPDRARRTRPGDDALVAMSCDDSGHVLETERLTLRQSTPADIPALQALVDPVVRRWMGWERLSEDDLHAVLASQFAFPAGSSSASPRLRRERGAFVIIAKADATIIGERSWNAVDGTPGLCGTGSWIGSEARRQGFGLEELRGFCRFAHAHLGFHTIWAQTNHTNGAARAQYLRGGFTPLRQVFAIELPNSDCVTAVGFEHVDFRARLACGRCYH